MRWEFGRGSRNVEDRRGQRMPGSAVVGGGIGTILLALLVTLLGGDPSVVLEQAGSDPYAGEIQSSNSPRKDREAAFVSAVLLETEKTWGDIFRQSGATYREPGLVLFSGATQTGCGFAKAAMGPFYCPADQKVYIDLSFYDELESRHRAPGDFAQAYVIAHEVGHHVQKQLGTLDRVQALQRRVDPVQANQLLVRLELQADCYAGVWARNAQEARQILEPGDIEEALNAVSSVGDDRLQMEARGYVVPDSFTHGTSAQRVRWFKQGLQTGDPSQCNTFEARNL
ncbi:MAG: neutral zinc metallopeptidase [Synechococcales cyanobacterium C42_A2020_086]|jgi:predicted metalloprotease|nr:neutral zinc metallopeptidase [Synechococcales cyanobacterium C42_A2020_086]